MCLWRMYLNSCTPLGHNWGWKRWKHPVLSSLCNGGKSVYIVYGCMIFNDIQRLSGLPLACLKPQNMHRTFSQLLPNDILCGTKNLLFAAWGRVERGAWRDADGQWTFGFNMQTKWGSKPQVCQPATVQIVKKGVARLTSILQDYDTPSTAKKKKNKHISRICSQCPLPAYTYTSTSSCVTIFAQHRGNDTILCLSQGKKKRYKCGHLTFKSKVL